MGHLRFDCVGKEVDDLSKNTLLQRDPPNYMDEADSLGCETLNYGADLWHQQETLSTLTGKLQRLCPSLYSTLSLWEKEALDNSHWLHSSTSFDKRQLGGEKDTTNPVPPSSSGLTFPITPPVFIPENLPSVLVEPPSPPPTILTQALSPSQLNT